jgi:hypothetical protein
MKATVQVLANGNPRKTKEGKVFMHECQTVVLGSDVLVGVLKVWDRMATEQGILTDVHVDGVAMQVVPAGAYELEFGLVVSRDEKEIIGGLKSIKRIGAGNAVLAALNPDAKKPEQSKV